mgnify:CR=1 FL=1
MIPIWCARFGKAEFARSFVFCEGHHVSSLIRVVEEASPGLVWYASDVLVRGSAFWREFEGPTPRRLGSAAEAIRAAETAEQFESGVLSGVPRNVGRPVFRAGGVWTEDEEASDLGDSVVEIRAFDTTFLLVVTTLPEVRARFGGSAQR